MKSLVSLIMCISLLLGYSPSIIANDGYIVEGYVYDSIYGELIDNALVQLVKYKDKIEIMKVIIKVVENLDIEVKIDNVSIIIDAEYLDKMIKIKFEYEGMKFRLFVHKKVGIYIMCLVKSEEIRATITEEGYYRFDYVDEGKYMLIVSHSKYVSYTDFIEVKQNLILTTYLLPLQPIIRNIENEIRQLEDNVLFLKNEIDNIKERLTKVEVDIDLIKERISRLEQNIENLEEEIVRLNDRINELWAYIDNTIKTMYGYIENLRRDIYEYINEVKENIMSRVRILEERTDNVELKINELEIRVSNLELKVREIEEKITIPEGIPKYSIEGKIWYKDEEFMFPFSNQYVWLLTYNLIPIETYTDEEGYYRFDNVVGDRVVLRYRDLRYEWVLDDNDYVRIVYEDNNAYVVGKIYGYIYLDNELFENDVRVSLIGEDYEKTKYVVGYYEFDYVPIGEYKLIVSDNYKYEADIVITHKTQRIDIDFKRVKDGKIQIDIKWAGIAGIIVLVGAITIASRRGIGMVYR